MTDHKMQAIADSALLKVLQYAITAIAVPGVMWFGNRTLDQLEKVEAATSLATLQGATFELRIKQLEATGIERKAAIELLTQQVLRHDFELRRLTEDRTQPLRGR
jgi:hypothetical protein